MSNNKTDIIAQHTSSHTDTITSKSAGDNIKTIKSIKINMLLNIFFILKVVNR